MFELKVGELEDLFGVDAERIKLKFADEFSLDLEEAELIRVNIYEEKDTIDFSIFDGRSIELGAMSPNSPLNIW